MERFYVPELTIAQFFGLQFSIGVLAGLAAIAWSAVQRPTPSRRIGAWLDVALAALVSGLIAARVVYVLMDWDYFRYFPEDWLDVWYGGVEWHSGIIGGLVGAWGMARLQKVSFAAFSDGLALALPLGIMGGWWACRHAGCGCGRAVNPQANVPTWLTGHLIDLAGDVTLRYETQVLGVGATLMVLIGVTWLTVHEKWAGYRLWGVLFCIGLTTFWLGFLAGNPSDKIWGIRTGQILDITLMIVSVLGLWLYRRFSRHGAKATVLNPAGNAEQPT
ncbi:MAG: prolipoprotein diacylglyceryl transferase [Chloroflexota bacterium]|nr:MAG: prolipoprotein diacylglyceryl transferase [Chloroflexota bacterium]